MKLRLVTIDELVSIPVEEAESPRSHSTSFYPGGFKGVELDAAFIKKVQLSALLTEALVKREKSEKTAVHGALSVALVLAKKKIADLATST